MSQLDKDLDKDFLEKISFVILCAGEGIRLKDITKSIPKPLIRIKELNNSPILQHNISNLIRLNIQRIFIIKGHLGNKIEDFVISFTKANEGLQKKLMVIDSGTQYKLGPLFSFLSITKYKTLFLKEKIFIVIPGDTIFEYDLLNNILESLMLHVELIQKFPFSFYRKIKMSELKPLFGYKKISISEVIKKGKEKFLNEIKQVNLLDFSEEDYIKQTIPVFVFPYDFINEIMDFKNETSVKSIRQMINYMILQGKRIIAVKINANLHFYDIDYNRDLELFAKFSKEKKKGE